MKISDFLLMEFILCGFQVKASFR
jgi:hypothetical protein